MGRRGHPETERSDAQQSEWHNDRRGAVAGDVFPRRVEQEVRGHEMCAIHQHGEYQKVSKDHLLRNP